MTQVVSETEPVKSGEVMVSFGDLYAQVVVMDDAELV